MFFRRPKITITPNESALNLLIDALSQYGINISHDDGSRELQSLCMDDIDLLEAVQLVEKYVDARVDRKIIVPSTTLTQLAEAIDRTRRTQR